MERLLATPSTTPRLPAMSFPPSPITPPSSQNSGFYTPGARRRKGFRRAVPRGKWALGA
jgi:hypothetical protein